MTKLAIIRGDFASPWELQNFEKLPKNYDLTVFTGYYPLAKITETDRLKIRHLFSPVDLNLGTISRWRMGLLNRVFVDAHILFGLEKSLSKFDIAHTAETYYSFTMQSVAAKQKGIVKKVVSTVWENIPFNNESIRGRKKFKQLAFTNVDLFLAVTRKSKDALILEGCDHKKIEVLKPGIDLDRFGKKTQLNKPTSKILKILFVGRLENEKGIDLLLRSFERINKKIKTVKLVIVGKGNKEPTVIEAQRRNPNITFLGNVPYDEMPDTYSSCDIFAHPAIGSDTWQEQYGMVLIEAMASGLPILSVDRGSITEIVGESGVVVNPEQFEDELSSLIENENKRRKLIRLAIQNAHINYDANKYARRLDQIYKEISK